MPRLAEASITQLPSEMQDIYSKFTDPQSYLSSSFKAFSQTREWRRE